jgi:hypothetical protein
LGGEFFSSMPQRPGFVTENRRIAPKNWILLTKLSELRDLARPGIAIAAGDIVLGEAAIETDTAEEQPNEQ